MEDRFELSFKNKAVVMYLVLMLPTVAIQLVLTLFTDVPRIYPASLPAIPLLVYFIWLPLHKRKLRDQQNG